MNNTIEEYFNDRGITITNQKNLNTVRFFNTSAGAYISKPAGLTNLNHLEHYLNSRSFNHFVNIKDKLTMDDQVYYLFDYLEDVDLPKEQRINDLFMIVAKLHKQTVFNKQVSSDYYKKIYENIANDINYLKNYYEDVIRVIEGKIYYSPSELLFARNYTLFIHLFEYLNTSLKQWYELVEHKNSIRQVTIHNNLDAKHLIVTSNEKKLISWDKSMINIPVIDLVKLYRLSFKKYDFANLLKIYEKKFPLLEDEKLLFYILISMPDKIIFNESELNLTKYLTNYFFYLNNTNALIKAQETPKEEDQETKLNEQDDDVESEGQEQSN